MFLFVFVVCFFLLQAEQKAKGLWLIANRLRRYPDWAENAAVLLVALFSNVDIDLSQLDSNLLDKSLALFMDSHETLALRVSLLCGVENLIQLDTSGFTMAKLCSELATRKVDTCRDEAVKLLVQGREAHKSDQKIRLQLIDLLSAGIEACSDADEVLLISLLHEEQLRVPSKVLTGLHGVPVISHPAPQVPPGTFAHMGSADAADEQTEAVATVFEIALRCADARHNVAILHHIRDLLRGSACLACEVDH